jgi:hypothetical protein
MKAGMRLWFKQLLVRLGWGDRLIEFCQDCGRKQPLIWRADDALWLALNDNKAGGVLCPQCFDDRATRKGMLLRWTAQELSFCEKHR